MLATSYFFTKGGQTSLLGLDTNFTRSDHDRKGSAQYTITEGHSSRMFLQHSRAFGGNVSSALSVGG